MDLTICITTFKERYHFVSKLVSQIRSYNDMKILISINGERDGSFDNEYRKNILELCSSYDNVYPIFFIEMRGLSKMWNTLLSHSPTRYVLMLNDDLEITKDIFRQINTNNITLNKINNSYSHYLVDKELIDKVGWFDERLLGFGEEDGDIHYRIGETGIKINNIRIDGLINIVSDIRQEEVTKSNGGKYTEFNRNWIQTKYIEGYYDGPNMFSNKWVRDKSVDDTNSLPYERFFWDNKNKLYK